MIKQDRPSLLFEKKQRIFGGCLSSIRKQSKITGKSSKKLLFTQQEQSGAFKKVALLRRQKNLTHLLQTPSRILILLDIPHPVSHLKKKFSTNVARAFRTVYQASQNIKDTKKRFLLIAELGVNNS